MEEETYNSLHSELSEAKVGEQPDTIKSLNSLEKELKRLEENYSRLENRLQPVLQGDTPQETGKDRATRRTDLSEMIQKHSDKLDFLNNNFERLFDRIDL